MTLARHRERARRLGLWAGALSSALLAAAGAQAHLRFPKVKAERWIELRLDEQPIRLGYRIGYGAKLAQEQRRAADRDGDFEVSAVEGNAALDARSAELLSKLTVCTGPSLDRLDCRNLALRDIERVEAEGWVPGPSGHLHFTWTLRLRERATEIGAVRVEDAYDVSGVEISDVQVFPPRHTALTRAGEAGRVGAVVERFSWIEARRQPGPRVVEAAWAAPARTTWKGLVALLVAALAAVALWLGISRRGRRAAKS